MESEIALESIKSEPSDYVMVKLEPEVTEPIFNKEVDLEGQVVPGESGNWLMKQEFDIDSTCIKEDKFTLDGSAKFMNGKTLGTDPHSPGDYTLMQVQCTESSVASTSNSCNICCKSFNSASSLKKHIHVHVKKNADKRVHRKRRLGKFGFKWNTKRIHKGKCQFLCRTCRKSFGGKADLNRHMRIHTGERPFTCDVCSKSFSLKGTLSVHMVTHTGERPFSCDVCGKSFNSKAILHNHIRSHTGYRPFVCEVCLRSFSTKGDFDRHPCNPFSCKVCRQSFNYSHDLANHMTTHSTDRPFSCGHCNKTFGVQRELDRHMQSFTHTGERPFSCESCNKSFSLKSSLNRHKQVHTGDRPYSCEICKKSFGQKITLNRHMYIHTKEKHT